MRLRARQRLRRFSEQWRVTRLSRVALGKYIVLYASLLHLIWAGLLAADTSVTGPTPVHVLVVIFGGRYRAAIVLAGVALCALVVIFRRSRIDNTVLAFLLIPQQLLLLMSAGGGIYATIVRHYADGVTRPAMFILADQLPVILAAVLYTVAVLEAASYEERHPE